MVGEPFVVDRVWFLGRAGGGTAAEKAAARPSLQERAVDAMHSVSRKVQETITGLNEESYESAEEEAASTAAADGAASAEQNVTQEDAATLRAKANQARENANSARLEHAILTEKFNAENTRRTALQEKLNTYKTVSYTHLTLPTKRIV